MLFFTKIKTEKYTHIINIDNISHVTINHQRNDKSHHNDDPVFFINIKGDRDYLEIPMTHYHELIDDINRACTLAKIQKEREGS